MSYTGERYTMVRLQEQSLGVLECGITICSKAHAVPSRIYPHHVATFVLKGKGTYVVSGVAHEIKSGQGFVIFPNISCSYTADEEEPWEYLFVVFSGPDAEALVHNAGIDEIDFCFEFDNSEHFTGLLYQIHTACKEQKALGYEANAYFMLVMSKLIEKSRMNKMEYFSARQYIKKAKRYIEQHYVYDMTIQEVADHVGVDRTYLYRLFINHLGMPPSGYINDFRLNKSIELMKKQEISLNNIALSVGFYDYSYFSKRFIKKYKISPGVYRKKILEED